ncbi:MAG: LysR family transcriptional regulator [Burkholderiaceae bacterium]|nr:LysR family transcriptional regulator [Burkholderiaceae bacterium]
MDLKQLSYFVRVAELGSFSRAADVINIAQPALSRQIRLLEVELRQNLLVRNGRGVTLSEAGKVLLEHSRGVLHQVERLREELSRVRGALAGSVVVGLPPSVAKVLTVPLTRAFRVALPEATLAITEGLSSAMQSSLLSGRLDIALLYNPLPMPELTIHPLLDEELVLVTRASDGAPQRPVALAELAGLPLIIPSRPNAIRMQVEMALMHLGRQPRVAIEIDGVAAILELVADGAGVAVLPRNAVRTAPQAERFLTRQLIDPPLVTQLAVAVNSHRPATDTQKAMLELVLRMGPEVIGR